MIKIFDIDYFYTYRWEKYVFIVYVYKTNKCALKIKTNMFISRNINVKMRKKSINDL